MSVRLFSVIKKVEKVTGHLSDWLSVVQYSFHICHCQQVETNIEDYLQMVSDPGMVIFFGNHLSRSLHWARFTFEKLRTEILLDA